MREIVVTRQFRKDIGNVPTHLQIQANIIVQQLRHKPTDPMLDIKKLQGFSRPPLWRVRIGDYRMVYTFDRNSITIHRLCHRKDVYRHL